MAANLGFAAENTIESNWGNFLHYLKIGQLDLAKGYAETILQNNPEAVVMLDLAQENPRGLFILKSVNQKTADNELKNLTQQILDIIEQGRYAERTSPAIIAAEIRRLSTTERGRIAAVKRLKNAGEYAIAYMVDAMADQTRQSELPFIIWAMPQIGKDAVRPLIVALKTDDVAVKLEIIKAMGEIGYPQSLAALKYIVENEPSKELKKAAVNAIEKIDPKALAAPAAQLFYLLAENYYYRADSLKPLEETENANIWFWNSDLRRLYMEKVSRKYFYEMMAMRNCEWALKADVNFGRAIGLWVTAFFKAELTGVEMPKYFGNRHPSAAVYATIAGPEYLHQALARALKDSQAKIALGIVEALASTVGENFLMYRLGPSQPLIQALRYEDRAVRYSAAIAVATAGPTQEFSESKIVIENLIEAITLNSEKIESDFDSQMIDNYAIRAITSMLELAKTRNRVLDLSSAQQALIEATKDKRDYVKMMAIKTLAYLEGPAAQRAIAAAGLNEKNEMSMRILAMETLVGSAKLNANLLDEEKIDQIYAIVAAREADTELMSAAATAFGALNLPSAKVKDLILDQAN